MSALSDILDGIQVLDDPPTPTDAVLITMAGANIRVLFNAENGIEIWNDEILQFRGDLNTAQTSSAKIQWGYGFGGFNFKKVPEDPTAFWAAELGGIEARGVDPETALLVLLA